MTHILLVEDLVNERDMIVAALEQRGVRVTAVGSDEDAYAVLRGPGARGLSGLVTDINLGEGTTGFDVARAARAVQPDLAVVYMTAFELETRSHAVADSLTLKKPLRVSDLADQILGYLTEGRGRGWDMDVGQASAG